MSNQGKLYVLAVDPGSRAPGAAVFLDAQLLDTWAAKARSDQTPAERNYDLICCLETWYEAVVEQSLGPSGQPVPEFHLAYESPSYFTAARPGGSRPIQSLERFVGALDFWGHSQGYRTCGYNVSTIKTGVVGRANASKEEVETALRHEYGLHNTKYPSHIWDAIAVGTYHLAQLRVAQAIERT